MAVVFAALALTVSAPSASAQTPCWKQIQDDWVDDGIIQGVYPLHCYGEAIKHVPKERIQLCTNCGMAPMRRDIAYAKLASLAKGAALARARYA